MAASTQIITDLGTADTTGPNATSLANSNAAAGPIQDLKGNINLALLKAKELKTLLTAINSDLDAGDTIKTQVGNVLLSLV